MRTELIHPLLVHFPIALLFTGIVLRLLSFFLRHSHAYRSVRTTAWTVLAIGVCMAWLTILAGEFAAGIVYSKLCVREVLENHSMLAYTATILFSAALLLDWGKNLCKASRFAMAVSTVSAFLFLGATIILAFVGFLGGSLVYDQGAAVEKVCK